MQFTCVYSYINKQTDLCEFIHGFDLHQGCCSHKVKTNKQDDYHIQEILYDSCSYCVHPCKY